MLSRHPARPRTELARPVLVARIDDNPFHHGTLGAIRSLGRLGVPVFMTQRGGRVPASLSRYLTGTVDWPTSAGDMDDLAGQLLRIALPSDMPAVLLPVDDAGAILFAERADRLRGRYVLPRQLPTVPRSVADKVQLAVICRRLGIPHPRSVRPPTWDALLRHVAANHDWPLVVKRTQPWLPPPVPGLKSTTIVHSSGTLREMADAATSDDPGLLLQDFIPPRLGKDWIVHGYYGDGSKRVVAWSGVKERSYPAYAGLTTLGRVVDNARVLELADKIAVGVGYSGICDMDFRYDGRDGTYKLLDFNPRLGAQFRLFTDSAHMDVVRAYYFDALGAHVVCGRPLERRALLVENYDPVASLRYWRDGELDLRAWLRSIRGVRELAWFASDDPLPFVAMTLCTVGRLIDKRRRLKGSTDRETDRSMPDALAS
jgi:D-aspartate ligase